MKRTPEVMTLQEAAKFLNLPARTLARQCKDGRVPCRKVGRQYRFLTESLREWLKNKQ